VATLQFEGGHTWLACAPACLPPSIPGWPQASKKINTIHLAAIYSKLPKLAAAQHQGAATPTAVECVRALDAFFDAPPAGGLGVRLVGSQGATTAAIAAAAAAGMPARCCL